jgi:hypothetical protein
MEKAESNVGFDKHAIIIEFVLKIISLLIDLIF